MKRLFIEFPEFSKLVRSGRIADGLLREIQNDIMKFAGDVIPGTGGLKKLRTKGGSHGKSGGVRTIYADYPSQGKTVLITTYFKNLKTNLTPAESKILAALKRRLDIEIGADYGKKET